MKFINEANITFRSNSRNESFARMSVAAFVSQLDPTVEELAEIKTVVSEAVTNCVVHAYENTIGIIRIRVQISDTRTVRITIKDSGKGIEDVETAKQPCYTTGSEDRAGMGFTIMESFSDKLTVKSAPGRGTTVVMDKRIIKRG